MREDWSCRRRGRMRRWQIRGSIALLLISWSRIWENFDTMSEFSLRNISRTPEGLKVLIFSLSRRLIETLGDLKALC